MNILHDLLPFAPYVMAFWLGAIFFYLFAPYFDIEIKWREKILKQRTDGA